MSHSMLVIGVGGGGKGICNHIKYECERVYGSLQKANTFIFSMDGLGHDGDYILPRQYEIDYSADSKECYKFNDSANPTDRLKNLVKGNTDDVFAQWLTQDQASSVLRAGNISPSAGFAGQRVPGHAYVFVDQNNIKKALTNVVNDFKKNSQTDDDMRVIVLVGTQVGGTGAGILSDVATMLADIITTDSKLWIWNLYPLSDTYAQLDQSTYDRSVKGFAGFLNLLRINTSTSVKFPFFIEYSKENSIKIGKYIHVPIVVDGEGENFKYNTVSPQKGVIPIMSDFIFSLIRDFKEFAAFQSQIVNYPAWIDAQPRNCKFASFGDYSLQYSWQEVSNTFKFRFANAFYCKVFALEPTAKANGALIADNLKSLNSFMNNLISLKFSIWNKTNITSVLTLMLTGSRDRLKPSLESLMNVKMTKLWPFTRSAKEFRNEAQAVQSSYLKEVKDFIGAQRKKITGDFITGIATAIEKIFYTKDKDENLIPKDLKSNPGSLIEFVSFLENLIIDVREFQKKLDSDYKIYKPEADKFQQAAGKRMQALEDAGTKRQLEEYLQGLVEYTKIEAWRLTIESIKGLTLNLIKYLDTFYSRVGDSANGWIGIFRKYKDETEKLWSTECNIRKERDEWLGRKYLPKTGGLAEDYLFEKVAGEVLDGMMEKMFWNICGVKADGKLIDYDNLSNPQETMIVLTIPATDEVTAIPKIYKNVITEELLKVTNGYSFFNHVQYSDQYIPNLLENLNIWEIINIDFEYGHMNSENLTNLEKNLGTYITKLRNEMINGADVGISGSATAVPDNERKDSYYLFAPANLNNINEVFTENLYTNVDVKKKVDTSKFNKHEIRLVKLLFGVDPTQTNSFTNGQADYLKYLTKGNNQPVDNYPNEQNAERLRKIVVKNVDSNFQRVYIPEVISLLNDYLPTYHNGNKPELTHVFEKFSLCYLSETLFKDEFLFQQNITDEPKIRLTIKNKSNFEYFILGEIWNLPEIAINVMRFDYEINRTWLRNPVRKKIIELWEEKEKELIKGKNIKEYLVALREKAVKGGINIEKDRKPDNKIYEFPISDLILAMRAAVIGYTNAAIKNLK
ncbi:MAG: tubulin-like doman-containing protein [Ignavibacteriaceae bacterium]|nr:tubulin-like doman-containing protein [Ignavibacteriaceae bacterium]